MAHVRSAIAALAMLLCASTAQANDYVLTCKLETLHSGEGWLSDGLTTANRDLEKLRRTKARAVNKALKRAKARKLWSQFTRHELGYYDVLDATVAFVKNGEQKFYRRRGSLEFFFRLDGELPKIGLLADARALSPHTLLSLEVRAFDRERGEALREPIRVTISLSELRAIRSKPAKVRTSNLGALLRFAWTRALDGAPDDLQLVEARVRLNPARAKLANGQPHDLQSTPLSPAKVDLLLARGEALATIDLPTAKQLARAVIEAAGSDDASAWNTALALRQAKPARGLTGALAKQ